MPNHFWPLNEDLDARSSIALAAFIRAAGDASPALRQRCEKIHALEHELDNTLKDCRRILASPAAILKLKASVIGRDLPPDDWFDRAFLQWSTEETKAPVDLAVRQAIRRHVEREVAAIGREIYRATADGLQADLDTLLASQIPLHRKYGIAVDSGGLAKALRAAIKFLEEQIAVAVAPESSEDVAVIMSRWFSVPLDEIPAPPLFPISELNTPPADAAPAPTATTSTSSTPRGLRSASDVAAARAA